MNNLGEAVAEVLRDGMSEILSRLNEIGLPSTADDQWRATIILRNVANDQATVVFGQDDEATLIVAMQIIGASRGRANYRVDAFGVRVANDE